VNVAERERLTVHLKWHRTLRRMSQQELAERAGVTRQTINAVERGRFSPSIELALRLARLLGVPVEALFELGGSARAGKDKRRG
jgi:putative transcriptional regulator